MNPTKKCVTATSQGPCSSVCKQALRYRHLSSLWWAKRCNSMGCQKICLGPCEGVNVSGLKSLPPPFWVQKRASPETEHCLEMASLFLSLIPVPLCPADSWKGSQISFPPCRSPQLQLQLDLWFTALLWALAAVEKILAKKSDVILLSPTSICWKGQLLSFCLLK